MLLLKARLPALDYLDKFARLQLGLLLLLTILIGGVDAISPLAYKSVIDGLSLTDLSSATFWLGVFIAAKCFHKSCDLTILALYGPFARRIRRLFIGRAFLHYLDMPPDAFFQNSPSENSKIISDALNGLQSVIRAFILTIIPIALQIMVTMGIIIQLHFPKQIAFGFLVFSLCYGLIFVRTYRSRHDAFREANLADVDTYGSQNNVLMNYETIKLNACAIYGIGLIKRKLEAGEMRWNSVTSANIRASAALGIASILFSSLLLLETMREVSIHEMTIGDFVLLNAYGLQIINPIERLGMSASDLMKSMAMFQKLPIAARPIGGQGAVSEPQRRSNVRPPDLALDGIAYRRNGNDILKDVNMHIPSGSMFGIMGVSGTGKSTLIKIISGYYEPTSGAARHIGSEHPVFRSVLPHIVSVVPQDTTIFNDSIRNNVCLGVAHSEYDLADCLSRAGLSSFVSKLPSGIETVLGDKGRALSGGERQRIAIARALFRKPHILILDEATSALDIHTEGDILDGLQQLKGKATVIIVSHKMATLAHCDEIFEVRHGTVVRKELTTADR